MNFFIRKICCTLYTVTEIAAVNTNRVPSINYLHTFQLLLEWQWCLEVIYLPFYSVNGSGELTFLFKKDFGYFLLEPLISSTCVNLCNLCLLCISFCMKKDCAVGYTYEVFFAHLFFTMVFFHNLQILHATALKFPHTQGQSVPRPQLQVFPLLLPVFTSWKALCVC